MAAKTDILNQAPPADRDAETWVVGSVILKPAVLDEIGWLCPDAFFHDDLRQLFTAMVEARHRGQPIDEALLRRQFSGDDWASRIFEVASAVPVASHVLQYARIVASLAKRRRLREILIEGAEQAQAGDDTPDAVLESVESHLAGIRATDERGEPITLAEASIEACSRIDEISQRGKGSGLPTGLESFDSDMGGLFQGELVILAARPGGGKTSLALQIAEHNAARRRLVYFASLEMSAVELSTRLACGESGVSNRLVRIGQLHKDDTARLCKAFNQQAQASLEIHDTSALTVAGIRREIRKRKKRGLALAVVDYLQLITPDDRKLVREQQVSRIVRTLKETAREYQIPILCLCQLNRLADENAVPSLSHLRESGSIEQDADVVIFLSKHEPTPAEPHNAILSVAKNRNGETGPIRLYWNAGRTRFSCSPTDDPFEEFE